MPLSIGDLPTELAVSVEDYNLETSTSSVFFANSFGLPDIIANTAAVEAILANLTDGNIVGASLSRRFTQTTIDPDGLSDQTSNVQRKGVFVFANEFGTTNTYFIPSIDRTLLLPGTRNLNRSAAAIQAYVAFMTGGLAGVTGSRPVGGNGRQLTRLLEAYEIGTSVPRGRS